MSDVAGSETRLADFQETGTAAERHDLWMLAHAYMQTLPTNSHMRISLKSDYSVLLIKLLIELSDSTTVVMFFV